VSPFRPPFFFFFLFFFLFFWVRGSGAALFKPSPFLYLRPASFPQACLSLALPRLLRPPFLTALCLERAVFYFCLQRACASLSWLPSFFPLRSHRTLAGRFVSRLQTLGPRFLVFSTADVPLTPPEWRCNCPPRPTVR